MSTQSERSENLLCLQTRIVECGVTDLSRRRKVEAAEELARENAEESRKAARNAEASNKQLVATMHEMEKAMREIEEDRETHVSAHAVLLRQVDKEKVKNRLDSISSGFKVSDGGSDAHFVINTIVSTRWCPFLCWC